MENRDFRSRLKNHNTEYNADAWSQMSEMLDAMPEEKKPESKSKLFWISFLIVGLLSAALFLFNNSNVSSVSENNISQKSNSSHQSTNKTIIDSNQKNEIITHQKESSGNELIKRNQVKTENYIVPSNSDNSASKSQQAGPSKPKHKDLLGTNKSRGQQKASAGTNGITNAAQNKAAKANENSKSSTSQDIEVSNKVTQGNNSPNKVNRTDEPSEDLTIESSNSTLVIPSSEKSIENSRIEELLLLVTLAPSVMTKNKRTLKQTTQIITIQNFTKNKLFWSGSVGGSDINGNRGYYIGAGIFWDTNKVIGVETDLSFSSAWDIKGTSNSFLSSEQELNLTLWAHLNLVRTSVHKLSLEVGPSIGVNWYIAKSDTQRQVNLPYYNLKAGASYTYFMANGNGLGVKGAFSLYDSGYVAFKYFKKF